MKPTPLPDPTAEQIEKLAEAMFDHYCTEVMGEDVCEAQYGGIPVWKLAPGIESDLECPEHLRDDYRAHAKAAFIHLAAASRPSPAAEEPPPVDNAHVAPGCEQFELPEARKLAHSIVVCIPTTFDPTHLDGCNRLTDRIAALITEFTTEKGGDK